MDSHWVDIKICMQNQHFFSCWIEQSLPSHVTVPDKLQLETLAGDAGFRRYFRVNTHPSLIAVDAPPEKEKNPAYVKLALFFQEQGLRTPKIYAVNYKQGYMLLEDFGLTLFCQRLEDENSAVLYDRAETALLAIQNSTADELLLPKHDRLKLSEELALFEQWFLNKLLGYRLSYDEKVHLEVFFEHLIGSAKAQPQVLVHADYHSRNLMILDTEKLGIIDFQDAMHGAITYDLVSLLKDCYVHWSPDWVIQRALIFKQRLEAAGLLANHIDDKQFLQWFDLMGLQRHIKVLGIFARLALRDAKDTYLNDIPLVVHYCLEASAQYPQTVQFNQWFKEKIVPLLAQQSWYCDYSDTQL